MAGIQVFLLASTEERVAWRDMTSESQVIYALVREAIEQAGYDLNEMQIDVRQEMESSVMTCRVEFQ